MPERALPIGTYVVGASLCAISLFYVFGPSFVFDADSSSHKRRIVGLDNPANMCFCNSVLQALANSPGLRKYLIRETHRRNLDGPEVYKALPGEVEGTGRQAETKLYKLDNLQQGIVTHGLKIMLDRLNERPLHKKTISATEFIICLETAFRTRISRQQQDAQEFLQIVLERLCEEYHAGSKARRKYKTRRQSGLLISIADVEDEKASNACADATDRLEKSSESNPEEVESNPEDSFPFEGQTEAQIECRTCGFQPKPTISTFVTLTLNVPQASQVNLNQCFDGIFKEEVIDDFKCNKCRLEHAKAWKERELQQTENDKKRQQLFSDLAQIESALSEDAERELPHAHLPELSSAPARTIKRSMRISKFPRVLAIHLSRSIYSALSMSTKNLAKVSFPETLSLGGLADPHSYRLSSVVMHKGGHNSGHYETFRRQSAGVPFSTPHSFGTSGVYSRDLSPNPSALQIPAPGGQLRAESIASKATSPRSSPTVAAPAAAPSPTLSHVSSLSQPSRSASSRSSRSMRSSLSTSLSRRSGHSRIAPTAPTSAPRDDIDANSSSAAEDSKRASRALSHSQTQEEVAKMLKRQKKLALRWWRVSDERVKEGKMGDVLGMQREVYLLFYEEGDA